MVDALGSCGIGCWHSTLAPTAEGIAEGVGLARERARECSGKMGRGEVAPHPFK